MKAWAWALLPVGVLGMLVFLAIAVGPVWLNTFIRTGAFRQEVERRASDSLGGPVQIDSINFSLWRGVELHGLSAQIDAAHASGQGALVARIEDTQCHASLLALLDRRLELTGVTLEKPQIILTRQPAAEVSTPSPSTGTPATPGGHATPFQFVLKALKVEEGAFSVRDATGASLGDLSGIDLSARTEDDGAITGKVRIAQVLLPSNLKLTDISTPFTYQPGAVEAKPFTASAFNGRLAGDYTLDLSGPSLLDVNAKGIDLAPLVQQASPTSGMKMEGSLDLQSKWRGVETGQLNGEGDAQVQNARIEGVPILRELSGLLRIKELEAPEVRQGQTHFLVDHGVTRFTGLQAQSDLFELTGDGTVGAGGALDANLVLVLTREMLQQIPPEAALFFVQRQDGSASIAFHVGGSTSHPQTDLASRILVQRIPGKNVLKHALNGFFH